MTDLFGSRCLVIAAIADLISVIPNLLVNMRVVDTSLSSVISNNPVETNDKRFRLGYVEEDGERKA
jgi:hypothetical protein